MTRTLAFAALASSLFAFSARQFARADEPKATGTVDVTASVPDVSKATAFEGVGVILSQKEWERLAANWGIKDVPKVDFGKELLLVGTWRGTNFKFLSTVKDGDLVVEQVGDKNVEPGFRYRVMSLSRAGITKFQGRALPPPAKSELEPIERATTVNLSGTLKDESLQNTVPANGVIASQAEWERLAKAWGLKEPPRVDFKSQILVVATTRGTTLSMNPAVKGGDLTLNASSTGDIGPGLRWRVMSVSRDGIKTVDGKPLPQTTELNSGTAPGTGTTPAPGTTNPGTKRPNPPALPNPGTRPGPGGPTTPGSVPVNPGPAPANPGTTPNPGTAPRP